MLRPNRSGAPVPSLDDVRGRPLTMTLGPVRTERRDLARRDAIVRRIEAEFHELPGLVLSLRQASRFLGVDEAACGRILDALIRAGALRRSPTEYYSRREAGH